MADLESKIGGNREEIRELLNIDQPIQSVGTDFAWYVGATGEDSEGVYTDFSETYITEGRWENGWDSKFVDVVKSVQVGDKIALKSAYTKKKGLPFNNNGKTVGVMGIKAIGIVTENPGDGKNLKVDWQKVDPIREWYGKGVLRTTIHRINAEDGLMKKLLLQFTFDGMNQDYSLCEEQYEVDLEENETTEEIIIEDKDKEYSINELGGILSRMYNSPDVSKKTTAIHMFGLKYGCIIKKNNYKATALAEAAGINNAYHAEISKGVRIYESISNNEYGVSFYDGIDSPKDSSSNSSKKKLPIRQKRVNRIHPINSILYGAPGTGKTYSTVEYALGMIDGVPADLSEKTESQRLAEIEKYNKLIDAGQIVFTTFHQNYGYEDFIQGLRPDTKVGGISFKDIDGVFKSIADVAISDTENNYVIIIDEINRANISKVFGELITLIEEDKRWGEVNQICVTLPSGEIFAVPNNLYILGTMNSSDKSISLIDAALRRRFEFIEQKPNASLIKDNILKTVFIGLNEKLADDLDSTDLLIGHSYFIGKTVDDLPAILNRSIIPLLYEYYYDNRKKVASILNEVLKGTNIELINTKMGRLSVKVKEEKTEE
jgi:5-methylcytosine-specific restriction endonuclease McrBC GTP-binding regulatory subunit McrB